MKNKISRLLIFFLLLLCFISCKKKEHPFENLSLDDCALWSLSSQNETIQDAKDKDFSPLKLEYCNLFDILGDEQSFVWVKFNFKLPAELKNKELGVVFPYINFADKAWCNGVFIGETGSFPPYHYSSLYKSHLYTIPQDILNQNGENTILLKIFSQGRGTISDGNLIAQLDRATYYANRKNFSNSKIYLLFEGILNAAFLFLLFFYFAKKSKYLLHFALSCLSTFFFLAFFSGTEWPGYGDQIVSFTLFAKFTLFFGFYFSTYSTMNFMFDFLGLKQPKFWIITKNVLLVLTIIITLAIKEYVTLLRLFTPMAMIYCAQLLFVNIYIFLNLKKINNKNQLLAIAIGFLPSIICIFIDFVARTLNHHVNHPFFMIFGWEITVTFFIFLLSLDYSRVFVQNEKFNKDLQRQIELRTVDLTFANEKLLYENHRAQKDLNMASIVQQKFFARPEGEVKNWEIAIVYEPLDKVSGDLYDFYIQNDVLNGFSLFDASGHGVAAALITMLSKNIIFKAFRRSLEQNQKVSSALQDVNDKIIKAKGDIENYLTGVMVRFHDIDENTSKVELSSAGHPYPVLYSAKEDKIVDLKLLDKEVHFGAIGMEGIEVSFSDIDFEMSKGDILVAFSDGIIELCDENRNSFGRSRLEELIKEHKSLPLEEILEILKTQAHNFRGDNPRDDDLTVIILKRV